MPIISDMGGKHAARAVLRSAVLLNGGCHGHAVGFAPGRVFAKRRPLASGLGTQRSGAPLRAGPAETRNRDLPALPSGSDAEQARKETPWVRSRSYGIRAATTGCAGTGFLSRTRSSSPATGENPRYGVECPFDSHQKLPRYFDAPCLTENLGRTRILIVQSFTGRMRSRSSMSVP